MAGAAGPGTIPGAASGDGDDSLYPIAVLIDELRNEDVQVLEPGRGEEAGSVGRAGRERGRPAAKWGWPGIERAGLEQKLEREEGKDP